MKTKPSPKATPRPGGRPARIICGTDFSEHAQQAVRVAAALGRKLGTPVGLVNAVEPPSLSHRQSEIVQWLKSDRRKALREEAVQLRESGVSVHEKLLTGRADEALVDLARESAAELLVVASLGRRGAARWFLGSVSERTAERADVPTLVVRDAAPFEDWAGGIRPLKVFVGFNFTATSDAALHWAKELHAIAPCELVVGYVDWPAEERSRLGGTGSLPLGGNPPEVQAILERDLKARVAEMLGAVPFRFRIEGNWGRADRRLADLAEEEGADLLVVGSHQYRGFERWWNLSVSRGVLHNASMNVAVVPLKTRAAPNAGLPAPVRRVLVTTDFSDRANHAIRQAYGLVRGGGTVHLLHIVHPLELPAGEYRQGRSSRAAEANQARHVDACMARLQTLIPAEAAALGIHSEVEVARSSDVAGGICQAAERFGADLICLGRHGESGLTNKLLGSVAQKVMAHSRRPLLVVQPPAE